MIRCLVFVALSITAVLGTGCYDIQPWTDIQLEKISETWKVIHYSRLGDFQKVKCFNVLFEPVMENQHLVVNMTAVVDDGFPIDVAFTADRKYENLGSVWTVKEHEEKVDVYFLDSDYNNYAVLYECFNGKEDAVYLLSRTTHMAYDKFVQALSALAHQGIHETLFHQVIHTNC